MATLFTQANQPLEVVRAKGARSGAEGCICQVVGKPGLLAKLYAGEAAAGHERKVLDMLRLPTMASLPANLTWPMAALYRQRDRREFAGYVMLKAQTPWLLGEVYAYPSRDLRLDQGMRLAAARSIAKTMVRLHAAGQAVGDGNPDNIGVCENGSVVFYDTDSFAITMPGPGRAYRCTVCRQPYVPREIYASAQGSDYAHAALALGERSDCYMLAIHVFRLLNNGAHPFAWQLCDGGEGGLGDDPDDGADGRVDMTLRDFVDAGRTPYFSRPVPGYECPSYALPMKAFPDYLVMLWRRAFTGWLSTVPTAAEWLAALERYAASVKRCRANPGHRYAKLRLASACPYCAADKRVTKRLRQVVGVRS